MRWVVESLVAGGSFEAVYVEELLATASQNPPG